MGLIGARAKRCEALIMGGGLYDQAINPLCDSVIWIMPDKLAKSTLKKKPSCAPSCTSRFVHGSKILVPVSVVNYRTKMVSHFGETRRDFSTIIAGIRFNTYNLGRKSLLLRTTGTFVPELILRLFPSKWS